MERSVLFWFCDSGAISEQGRGDRSSNARAADMLLED